MSSTAVKKNDFKGYAKNCLAFDLVHSLSALVSWKDDISQKFPDISEIKAKTFRVQFLWDL